MSQTIVLKVAMSCEGCVGAVKRVLDKMEGVESFDVDLKEQKVTVKGNMEPEAVLQTVSKSGKKTLFGNPKLKRKLQKLSLLVNKLNSKWSRSTSSSSNQLRFSLLKIFNFNG